MENLRHRQLPDFEDPPVAETVLSAQFDVLPLMRTAHLGLLWGEYRALFPKAEERPPIPPITERFPEESPRLDLRFQSTVAPPLPRLWFVNDCGDEMIQVQNDRFVKNWRKEAVGTRYPHYETIRPKFDRDYEIFTRFLEVNHLGVPRIAQCEVTYVNHILAGEGWNQYREAANIFTLLKSPGAELSDCMEDIRLHTRFIIRDSQDVPIGRLHVDVQPALRPSDHRRMYVLHLTARGQVGDGLDFLDIGREWIVSAFKHLTTSEMHKIWRIKNDSMLGNG